LSIILLPAVNFNIAQADGRLPSASRGPVQPVSETLAKSEAAGVMFKSHVLFAVSTPPMLVLSLGKPMLFLMTWAFAPVRVMVPVTPEESKLLANMLY
jgi:hypothetical protein